MTKFRKVLLGTIGLYILASLSLAQAQNAPSTYGTSAQWHPGQRIGEIYKQLDLTDDQKKQLEANKQQQRAKMESARKEMKTIRQEFQQELMKPQLDMLKVNTLHNQMKLLQSQMEDDRLSSILAVRAILTPEQFTKFVDLMHKHKQEHN